MEFPYLTIGFLLFCSSIFSSSETSFLSLNRIQLRELEESSPRRYQKIRFLLDRPTSLIVTIMIGNECANVIISHVLASYYHSMFDSWPKMILLNICTAVPLIVIFGEITPRIIAAKANIGTAKLLVPLVWLFYRISLPIRIFIEIFVNSISRWLGIPQSKIGKINEEDFLYVVEDSKSKGAIGDSEKELIHNVFELDDDTALEISTPLKDFLCFHVDDDIEVIIPQVKESKLARIPIIGDFPNQIIGVLYTKDLLVHAHRTDERLKAKNLMKEPMFVQENVAVEALFKRMRQQRIHIVFVNTENNTTVGVITMDDVLDQIFGEIWQPIERAND